MIERAEIAHEFPLARAFAERAAADPRGLALLIAAATVYADYGATGFDRRTTLCDLALCAHAGGKSDDAVAAARASIALTEEDDLRFIDGFTLGRVLVDCGHPQEALPLLEGNLTMLEGRHARRPLPSDEPIHELRALVERARREASSK
jgi:hypothetical protein